MLDILLGAGIQQDRHDLKLFWSLSCHVIIGIRYYESGDPALEPTRLFGGANGRLWEGSLPGVLPRTSAASVPVPTVSHSHPPPLQETLQH